MRVMLKVAGLLAATAVVAAGCSTPTTLTAAPAASAPSAEGTKVVMTDYVLAADGSDLLRRADLVVTGSFGSVVGHEEAAEHGVGRAGQVDVWRFDIASTIKGVPAASVRVARWPDTVIAGQFHVSAGTQAVLFLSATKAGAYVTFAGDQGLLLMGSDRSTLSTTDGTAPLAGTATVDQVEALVK